MSTYKNIDRGMIKSLASEIEKLARELQTKLTTGADPLMIGNELVRNTSTLVFSLGELYHAEQTSGTKTVTVTPVGTSSTVKSNVNYYNKRDSRGRFTA